MADKPNYRNYIWFVLGATLFLRIIGTWFLPLTDTTEARYSEIARKMAETGNWITPLHDYNVSENVCAATACVKLSEHSFGLPFWAKPPLSIWATAASMKVFGVNEFAARLPSLLFSLALLALLYCWLKQYSKDLALTSITILSTSLLFFGSAGLVMTDLALIFCSFLAMVSFWESINRPDNRYWRYIFFVSLGLGLLAKGPLTLVLVGLPTGLWTLFHRKLIVVWKSIPWITGIVIAIAIAAPWYYIAEQQTPGFLRYFIVGEHFSRFLISGWHGDLYGRAHSEPLGTIWLYLTLGFLPWFGFIIVFVIRQFKQIAWSYPRDPWRSYLVLWTLMPVIFFTFAHNIIPPYALPAMPAGAILIAELLPLLNCDGQRSKAFFITSLLTPVILLCGTLAYLVMPNSLPKHSEKELVLGYLNMSEKQNSQLWYYDERRYSAEFYSRGKVKIIRDSDYINQLKNNELIDYIAVDKRFLDGQLAQLLSTSFKVVGKYREMSLYQECEKSLCEQHQ